VPDLRRQVLRLTSDVEIGVLGTGRLDKGFINLLRRIISTKGPERPASGQWPLLAAWLDRDDNLCMTRECVTSLDRFQSLKYSAFATPIPHARPVVAWPTKDVSRNRTEEQGLMHGVQ